MVAPKYSWMFFNWYSDNWWKNGNCTRNNTNGQREMAELLSTSLIFDHYPRIDENDKNKTNIGNIVSCKFYLFTVNICIKYAI